jgi:hypothetical protein
MIANSNINSSNDFRMHTLITVIAACPVFANLLRVGYTKSILDIGHPRNGEVFVSV